MMRISVWNMDLSDSYLKKVVQLGAEGIDFGDGAYLPGVKEHGYPDLDALIRIKKRIQSYGMEINRVTLPDITERFMLDREGGDAELENTIRAMQVFGEAKVPIARQRFTGDTFNHLMTRYDSVHRGGYRSHAMIWRLTRDLPDPPSREELDRWWTRFCLVYEHLVPLAEESGVKLALHPSDVPLPETPFGTIGFHRVIDTFPSRSVGYLYCCGTRAEAGGLPLVLDEINNYGRKGRIFMIHFRNIRGSFSTSHGYEETLLDDGDMNMFKILLELKRVGFDGYLNADHIPAIEGDAGGGHHGLAYSIGYIKAMLAALAAI